MGKAPKLGKVQKHGKQETGVSSRELVPKKGLSCPSVLLPATSQEWEWVAEAPRCSGQDQRSEAGLGADTKIPGRVWIRHGVLQVICEGGAEAGRPLSPLGADKQLMGQGLHIRVAGSWIEKN